MVNNNAKKAILSFGTIAAIALEVANKLTSEGKALDAYSLPCLKPINEEKMIKTLCKYNVICTLEEHNIIGGLSSIISDIIARNGLAIRLQSFAINDRLCCEVGDQDYLRQANKIDFKSVYKTISEDW